MDLDVIILDDRLPHGPDGLPAQWANDDWKDHALVGNFLKYSSTSLFGQCMFDMWKKHWNEYIHHHAECGDGCQFRKTRDLNKQWGFMGPTLVTHAYLSCKDKDVSVYPPSAFGNVHGPCNIGLVQNNNATLKWKTYALHTCHQLTYAVDDLGGNMNRNSTMANVMQDRCPETMMRMYSPNDARKKQFSKRLPAHSLMHP